MRYCPDCGTGHDCEGETEGRTDPGVEIARIQADRDIAVAKLAARSQREELETVEEVAAIEADAEVESSVTEAEIVGAAIEAGAVPDAQPVIIDAPVINDDDQATEEPPDTEGTPPPEPQHKASGLGMW